MFTANPYNSAVTSATAAAAASTAAVVMFMATYAGFIAATDSLNNC